MYPSSVDGADLLNLTIVDDDIELVKRIRQWPYEDVGRPGAFVSDFQVFFLRLPLFKFGLRLLLTFSM